MLLVVLGDAVNLFMFKLAEGIHNVVSVVAFEVLKEYGNSLM